MQRYNLKVNGTRYVLDVSEAGPDAYRVETEQGVFEVKMVGGEPKVGPVIGQEPAAEGAQPPTPSPQSNGGELRAPMPGTILSVHVQPGEAVTRGQQLCVLEAMKMKNPIRAPHDGVVAEVSVQAGQSVQFHDLLLRFEG